MENFLTFSLYTHFFPYFLNNVEDFKKYIDNFDNYKN